MRKSIATVKNFKDNSVTEYIKHKPDDITLRGTTTIQLFDENGDMIKEMESENIIYSTYSKLAYVDYFQKRLYNNSSESYYDFASQIFLMPDSTPERDCRWWFDDNTYLARANTRSAEVGGTSLGTYNTGESFLITEYEEDGSYKLRSHKVYDFATNSANGTFRKIVHGYSSNALTTYHWVAYKYSPVTTQFSYNSNSYSGVNTFAVPSIDGSDDVYLLGCQSMVSTDSNYSKLHIIKMNFSTGFVEEIKDIPFTLKVNGKDTRYTTGVAYNGKLFLHMAGYNTTAWVIDLESRTYQEYTELPSVTSAGWSKGGFVDGGYLYMLVSNDGIFRKYNLSTNTFEGTATYHFYRGTERRYPSLISPTDVPGEYWICCGSYMSRCRIEGTRIVCEPKDSKSYSAHQPVSISGERSIGESYSFSTSTRVVTRRPYIQDIYAPIIAENLLPEPITKTSVNTMKIKYDFVIEGVSLRD